MAPSDADCGVTIARATKCEFDVVDPERSLDVVVTVCGAGRPLVDGEFSGDELSATSSPPVLVPVLVALVSARESTGELEVSALGVDEELCLERFDVPPAPPMSFVVGVGFWVLSSDGG